MCNCGGKKATRTLWQVKYPNGHLQDMPSQAAATLTAAKTPGAVVVPANPATAATSGATVSA